MHVLVTGCGGLIGRSVIEKARTRGWKVLGVARRQCKEAGIIADLRDPIINFPVPDTIIHLAGGYAGSGMRELTSTDIVIARNLINWSIKEGIRKLVFASAAEVYGDIKGVADEGFPCLPVIPYGKIKLQIEEKLKASGIPEVMICRIGEVYGPGGRILLELGGKLRSGFCPWAGDGNVKISFVHSEDVAEALLLACENAKPGFNIYNVGDDEPATWRQFLDEIAELLNVKKTYNLPKPIAYGYAACVSGFNKLLGRPASITPQVLRLLVTPKIISNAKVKEHLGFVPKYPGFQSGLKEALNATLLPD
jgi:nucleoside-diphosphate-sugar epimerase